MSTPPLFVPMNQKLGIKPGNTVCLLNAPPEFIVTLATQVSGARIVQELVDEADIIHIFSTNRAELEAALPQTMAYLGKQHALWISWPRKISGIPTDLNEEDVRAMGIARDLVDVKTCAVDDLWSGIKFVYKLQNR